MRWLACIVSLWIVCVFAGLAQAQGDVPAPMASLLEGKQNPFLEGILAKEPDFPGALGSKDPFPPFFGQDQGQAGQMPQQPALDGCWAAQTNQGILMLLFQQGMCGLMLNNTQLYGSYQTNGNQLHVQFSNGKSLDVTYTIQGNQLALSNGLRLTKQNMQAQQSGYPQQQPYPQTQQGYPQQQPYPQTQQGYPQQQPGYPQQQPGFAQQTPLEGNWKTQLPNGVAIVFSFHGNIYTVMANGQTTEQGTFTLQGNRLEYAITQGQAQGQRGVNLWEIQGTVLMLTLPNGMRIQFQRA